MQRVWRAVVLIISLAFSPLAAEAQQTVKVPRIGYLSADGGAAASHLVEGFRQGLRTFGYVDGQSVTVSFPVK